MEKMIQMLQYRELRVHTRLDDLNSPFATITIAEELTTKLKEELKEQAEQANRAQDIEEQLQKALDASQAYQDMAERSGNKEFQRKADQMLAKAKEYNARLMAAKARLEESCNANASKIRSSIRSAAESALKNARSISEAMDEELGAVSCSACPSSRSWNWLKSCNLRSSRRWGRLLAG